MENRPLLMSLPLTLDYEYTRDPETGLDNLVVWRDNPVRFDAHAEAPMTEAKKLVISFGRFGWQAFFHEWASGEIDGVPFGCCKPADLYKLFRWWVGENHDNNIPFQKFINCIRTKMSRQKRWCRVPTGNRPEEKKQTWVFLPKNLRVPDGVADMDFIGTQVLRFARAVFELTGDYPS